MKGAYIIGRLVATVRRGVIVSRYWEYWTSGQPRTSLFPSDAYRFTTYATALECCGSHQDLRNSDEWRVLRADGKSLNPKNRSA